MFTQVGVKQLTDFLRTVTAASDLVDCTLVNCDSIPGESCLQMKAHSVTIVRRKICLGFFLQKHVFSSVEMAVSEINDNKPVINYIPWFLISVNSFRIYATILAHLSRRLTVSL